MPLYRKGVVALAILICSLLGGIAYAAPKAVVEESVFHAGDIPQGTPITTVFLVKNMGDEPLMIQVKACCGMKVFAPAGPIEPGAAGKITISIATFQLRGKYQKDIEIRTNDPERKDMTVTVQATIQETLSITPAYVNFGKVKQGSNYVMEVVLANNGKDPVTLSHIAANPAEQLSISPRQRLTLKPGERKRFMLTFIPGKYRGIVEGSVLIKTDLERMPEKNISVRAEVVAGR